MRVTRDGAIAAVETVDGTGLLLAKPDRPGLWRLPLPADHRGAGTLVLSDLPALGDWGNWAVGSGGVALARYDEHGTTLVWLDLASLKTETVASVPGIARPSLAVSPDGSSILYARIDHRDSDVMVVESLP